MQFCFDAGHAMRGAEHVPYGELCAQHVIRQTQQNQDAGEHEQHARLAQPPGLPQHALTARHGHQGRSPIRQMARVGDAPNFRRGKLDVRVTGFGRDRVRDVARPRVVYDKLVAGGGGGVSNGVWTGGVGVSSVCRRRELDVVVAQLMDEARVEDDDEGRWDDARHERVDRRHRRCDVVMSRLRRAGREVTVVDGVVGEDRVGVDEAGEHDQRGDDQVGSALCTKCVATKGVEHVDVTLHGETDDAPRGQESARV